MWRYLSGAGGRKGARTICSLKFGKGRKGARTICSLKFGKGRKGDRYPLPLQNYKSYPARPGFQGPRTLAILPVFKECKQ